MVRPGRLTLVTMIQDDSSFGNGVRVDCNDGESINRAIRRSNLSEKLTIVVRGTCVENVVIDRDWVTLQPSKWGGGSIEAADETKDTIRITGRHVTVQDFDGASISGGSNGILVTDGAAASILRNTITDNGVGVVVDGASSALLEGNQIDSNAEIGVLVTNGSNARFFENDVDSNDGAGGLVNNGSSANLLGDNSFSNNGFNPPPGPLNWGFTVGHVSVVSIRGANTFAGNAGAEVLCGQIAFISVFQKQMGGGNGGADLVTFGGLCEINGTFF